MFSAGEGGLSDCQTDERAKKLTTGVTTETDRGSEQELGTTEESPGEVSWRP